MSNGAPYYVAKTGLETMPFTFGDGALANIFGTSATVSGADGVDSVSKALNTSPESASDKLGFLDAFDTVLSGFISVPGGAPGIPILTPSPTSRLSQEQKTNQTVATSTLYKVAISVLFVVIGLFVLSRGFGLLGEEGSDVIVNLGDPAKFPGIGHAIQGVKKGKK